MSFARWVKAFRALAVTAVVLVVVVSCGKQLRRQAARGDVEVYAHAARLVLEGRNIYTVPEGRGGLYYLYPPLFAVLSVPLTPLRPEALIVLWCVLNVLLVGWAVAAFYGAMTKRSFFALDPKARWAVGFFSVLLTLRAILYHLDLAQANIPVMAVAVFGLWLVGRGKRLWGGAAVGVSVVLKVLTLPLTVLFLARRDMRAVLGVAAGVLAGLFVPALALGFERNWAYLDYWLNNVLLTGDLSRSPHWPLNYNYSLTAQLYRFFGGAAAFEYGGRPYSFTFFRLPDPTIRLLGRAVTALAAAAVAFYALRHRKRSELVSLWGGAALAFALVPVFSPVAHKHYYVMLLPAHVYVVHLWYCLGLKDRWFRVLVVASFALATLSTNAFGQLGGAVVGNLGGLAWGAVLLAASVFRAAEKLPEKAVNGES